MSDSTRTKIAFGGLALSTALAVAIAQEPLRPVAAPDASTAPGDIGPVPQAGEGATPGDSTRAPGVGGALQPLRPSEGPGGGPLELDLRDAIAESLSILDLDAREAAFDRWASRASQDPAVRAALGQIAEDTSDVDLAFAARLALRESGRASARRAAPGIGPGSPFGGRSLGADPFDEMRREMERVFGGDPFFGGASPFTGRGGVGPFTGRDPFETFEPFWRGGAPGSGDLQERIDRMHAEIEEVLRGGNALPPAGGSSLDWRSTGMSVEMTPEGVKVTITEQGADGQETRTYEAPTMDELLEAHPELRGRIR